MFQFSIVGRNVVSRDSKCTTEKTMLVLSGETVTTTGLSIPSVLQTAPLKDQVAVTVRAMTFTSLGMRLLTSPSRENSTRKSSPLHEVKRNVHNNKVNIHYIALILCIHPLVKFLKSILGTRLTAQMKYLFATQHYKLVTHYSYNYIIFFAYTT